MAVFAFSPRAAQPPSVRPSGSCSKGFISGAFAVVCLLLGAAFAQEVDPILIELKSSQTEPCRQ